MFNVFTMKKLISFNYNRTIEVLFQKNLVNKHT